MAVVQVVLLGRKHRDRGAGLLAWVRWLLRRGSCSDHQSEKHQAIPHTIPPKTHLNDDRLTTVTPIV